MNEKELIEGIRKYAIEHYEEGGWDVLVECWDDATIMEHVGARRTLAGAIAACGKMLKIHDDYRKDIQATAF